MATIVLCPGQGAQHVGMGKAWYDQFEVAREIFAEADATLGLPISELCFEGPEEELNRTDIAQAAICTTSVACFRSLGQIPSGHATAHLAPAAGTAGGGEVVGQSANAADKSSLVACEAKQYQGDQNIVAVAGLSLGEFTALHLAGVFDFQTTLRLVQLRGQAMQQAAVATSSGMVALIGCDPAQANELCAATVAVAGDGQVLVAANFNCPGQVVVSGTQEACEKALAIAEKMNLRATPLTVAGAFHSPVMQPAVDRLAEALEGATFNPPGDITIISNVTAMPHEGDIKTIKRRLLEQLTSPVRWLESMQWLLANVEGQMIELAPGRVLAGLMRRIDRKIKVDNFAEPTG